MPSSGFTSRPIEKNMNSKTKPKVLLSSGQKFLDQLKLETSQRPKSPPAIPIISKIPILKRSQSFEIDLHAIKKLNEQNKKIRFK